MSIEWPVAAEAVNSPERQKSEIVRQFETVFSDLGVAESPRMLEIRTINAEALDPVERGTLESEYRILVRRQVVDAPREKQSDLAVGVNMACAAVLFEYGEYDRVIADLKENLEQAEFDLDIADNTVERIEDLIGVVSDFMQG